MCPCLSERSALLAVFQDGKLIYDLPLGTPIHPEPFTGSIGVGDAFASTESDKNKGNDLQLVNALAHLHLPRPQGIARRVHSQTKSRPTMTLSKA